VLIGISGKATAGKDAIAARLVEHWGFARVSFADGLREEVMERLPLTVGALHDLQDVHLGTCDQGDREACIREMLYVTKPLGFRQLLQEYGTDVRRRDDPEWWTKRWTERAARGGQLVVSPDVRFPNEADAVKAAGGLLWRVIRPGLPDGAHESERALDGYRWWDAVIVNDGTLEDLWARVDVRMAERGGRDVA
jgi:hypothetical protein